MINPLRCDGLQANNIQGLVSVDGDKVSTLDDFNNLSSQIHKASPTGVKKSNYSPSNSALQSCPTVGDEWQAASSPLPPSPNQDLCSCMEESLECVAKDNVSGKQVGKLFGTVCGYDVCDGVTTNATTGNYGAYSVCSPKQQLSFAMNQYYKQSKGGGNAQSACDFDGAATTKTSSSPSGTCSALLKEAGSKGTGTVTSSPTGNANQVSASGSSSSSGSQGAAPMVAPSSVRVGALQLGAYVMTAVVAGAGMILL